MTPAQRVKLIQNRMLEIGKPKNHCFRQGEKTWLFADGGWVVVSLDWKKDSHLYPPHKSFKTVWEEWISPSR